MVSLDFIKQKVSNWHTQATHCTLRDDGYILFIKRSEGVEKVVAHICPKGNDHLLKIDNKVWSQSEYLSIQKIMKGASYVKKVLPVVKVLETTPDKTDEEGVSISGSVTYLNEYGSKGIVTTKQFKEMYEEMVKDK